MQRFIFVLLSFLIISFFVTTTIVRAQSNSAIQMVVPKIGQNQPLPSWNALGSINGIDIAIGQNGMVWSISHLRLLHS